MSLNFNLSYVIGQSLISLSISCIEGGIRYTTKEYLFS